MKHTEIPGQFQYAAGGSRAAFVFVLLITLSLAASSAHAQSTTSDPAITTIDPVKPVVEEVVPAKSVVRGRAVYDDTNRPVRRSRVMLLELSKPGRERSGMTNNSGEFQIKEVPAGSYVVMVDASGIMTPLSLVDLEAKDVEKINFDEMKKYFDEVQVDGLRDITIKVRAKRGGVISGKVTYSDGDPAIDIRVNVMRKKEGRVTRFITNLNPIALFGSQTNDRGSYRVAGIPPGEYIVSATETVEHEGDSGDQRANYMGLSGVNSLVVTYYPGATKASNATTIQVNAGQDQNEINITLVDRVLHTVSGTVVARHDESPQANARVTISSKDNEISSASIMAPTGVATDAQGLFNFNELPDGVYTLMFEPPYVGNNVAASEDDESGAGLTATPARKLASRKQEVTLSGSDVTDLRIELTEGASISGTVVVEDGSPVPQGTTVSMETAEREKVSEENRVQPDGGFTINGVPSGVFFTNVILPSDSRFYAKMITVNGIDLMSDPLVISEGANVKDVRVVISGDGAILSGRILSGVNVPASNSTIMLIPSDQSRWRARASYRTGTSEVDGSYKITCAPGDYLIIFMRAGDQPRSVNEAWIRQRATNAQHVTLLSNQQKTLDLTVPVH